MMAQNRFVTAATVPLTSLWHRWLQQRSFYPPKKAIVLETGTASDVMLATPMLALLKRKYPDARFDWGLCESSIPIIVGNPNVTHLLVGPRTPSLNGKEEKHLVAKLKAAGYDTCYVPNGNSRLARLAKWAEIPQRIGLWQHLFERHFSHPVRPPAAERHRAVLNLALTDLGERALGYTPMPLAFYPSDANRKMVSERLIDQLAWAGDSPLVVLSPGVGLEDAEKCWPAERYVLLANRILKHHKAKLILWGSKRDQKSIAEVAGMIAGPVANWAGQMGYGELGALTDLADLYVGNDCGATLIAAAMGCKTIAIFGPTDPGETGPYHADGERVQTLWHGDAKRPFSWQDGVTLREAETAVRKLLTSKT